MATYPGGFWTFGFASKGLDPKVARRAPQLDTRHYTVEDHAWYFLPPGVKAKVLGST